MSSPNNSLSLGWYTLMINLHETGWHSEGEIAGWEHHYSSHQKLKRFCGGIKMG